MRGTRTLCLSVLLVLVPAAIPAQDVTALVCKLSDKVERLLLQREAGWKLVKEVPDSWSAVQKWRSGKDESILTIYYLSSSPEAGRLLKMVRETIEPSGGGKLEGLGDEAYRWKYNDNRGSVRFRKDNLVIIVDATSLDLADRFARHIITAIAVK
ncbi:MAG: hypothetical protein LAP85_19705 [Acidobacteriia bacterium]|nr:hypothetical protein [Terriglobia bacterium]